MWYSSKPARKLARLLGVVGLAAGLAACSTTPTNIGVGLPSVDANSGVYLLDTLTVRTSTVLRDSVVTSNSSYLLVGRALDPQLGLVRATSYFTPQLLYPFVPQSTFVLDSLVLNLATDNAGYRYGDTTQVQSLVRVYPTRQPLPAIGPLFAKPDYTPLPYNAVDTELLNYRDNSGALRIPRRRASPKLAGLHVRLSQALGERLLAAGKAGLLRTQDQLTDILPGIVLASADDDQASLVRLLASSADAGVLLYYHDPADAATPLQYGFAQTGGRHAFQVTVDRSQGVVRGLPTATLGKAYAEATGQQTVVQGAFGLQTRLEFPYLTNVRDLGRNLILTTADVTLEVPPATLSSYLPAPPTLNVAIANINNQPTSTYLTGLGYVTGTSSVTGQELSTYTLPVTNYVKNVLAGAIPNNGLLLSSSTPELPTRVLLGGPRNATNKLKLRLYIINTN